MTEFIEAVFDAAQAVFRTLGPGHTETLYRNAMWDELRCEFRCKVECEYSSPVFNHGHCIGMIRADLIVEDVLCVELKCKQSITDLDMKQAVKYERHIEKVKAAVIINFAPDGVQYRKVI